ncbi:transglutaminase family protein [Qingshengfaniella alkalisoli]|uniref:Transglutaminase family protein n=1 Tax=Qingshengfaniella alkalisoli TaxID=2599296 RepID=A0A5B8J439_9RHOB|nr:transglutaminase family protein [Qingshengfaniella alkalisoli]QDY69267.1 transglutaminase family protein [Qingshengfaniella alkalisoli]
MRLSISHHTEYSYEQPRRRLLQSQRLFPSVFDGQKIEEWSVTTNDAVVGAQFTDGAGDRAQTVSIKGPVTRAVIEVNGIVETTDLTGVLRGHRELIKPDVYLSTTRATRPDLAIAELGEGVVSKAGPGRLDQAHALSNAVSAAIAYMPGSTDARTTAAEALALGRGVCQDHTHTLIALAVEQAIPARYVTGYLLSDPEAAADSPTSVEASHAWAELYIADLGWVGFDPANGCCPDERYVRICSGYDAYDAAPIRGVALGNGGEHLDVRVAVQAVQQ